MTILYYYIFRYFKTNMKEDKLEKTANHSDSDSNDSSFNDYLKDYEEDLYLPDIDKSEKSANGKTDFKIDKEPNVSYNLFTIGPTESPQHERIIHGVKEYKMLVRTKTDGIEVRVFSYFY